MKKIHRFTLIELLAVIGLIAILGAIGFGVYTLSRNKAKESKAEAVLKQIEAGLDNLKANSHYPGSKNGGFNEIKVTFNTDGTVKEIDFGGETLTRQTGSSTKERIKQERFDAFVKSVDMQVIKNNCGKDGVLRDAWGGKIYYRSPGKFNKGSYDLISAGPDGKFGASNSATPSESLTDYRKDGDKVCDDIFNF